MARKRLGAGGTAKTITVTLSPVDRVFLELLAGELAHKRGEAGITTSEAVRFLLAEERGRPGRKQTLPVDGQDRDFAFFKAGETTGEEVLRRLDLQSGAVETVIRRKHLGGALVHDKVQAAKRKRR